RLARVETLRAALGAANQLHEAELSGLLRHRYQVMLRRAEAELAADGQPPALSAAADAEALAEEEAEAVRSATSAERQRLLALRSSGTIGDAAFQKLEQELDLEELYLQQIPGAERGEA
ncbi:MAG TPA: hypothetical protein VEQ58_08850, partial [Polyangiaceae bacterium]|nr:hypothetical protein [Polyangiaceae bacterium]